MVKLICLIFIKILHLDKKQTKFSGSAFRLQIRTTKQTSPNMLIGS